MNHSEPIVYEDISLAIQSDKPREHIAALANKLLLQYSQNNQHDELIELLTNYIKYIDINVKDEDNSTALIYSSCYGYYEIVEVLLKYKANVDLYDRNGWGALMWATNNKHQQVVDILLEYNACLTQRSNNGRTVVDIINHGSINKNKNEKVQRLSKILKSNSFKLNKNRMSVPFVNIASNNNDGSQDMDQISFYSLNTPNNRNENVFEVDFGDTTLENISIQLQNLSTSDNTIFNLNNNGLDKFTKEEFNWDECLSDQMLVYTSSNINNIIARIITTVHCSPKNRFVPANVLFLCARYAFYYNTITLMEELLNMAIKSIKDMINANKTDINCAAFWLANVSQLLYYFKRDTGLVNGSAQFQIILMELINEIYLNIYNVVKNELKPTLYSILDYESLQGIKNRDLSSKFNLIFSKFIRSNSKEMKRNNNPNDAINIISSTLIILKTHSVHPALICQILNQTIYFLSASISNLIMKNSKYCSRDRALQICMNITEVQNYLRKKFKNNKLKDQLLQHFVQLMQIVQTLQCLSVDESIENLLDLVNKMHLLSIFHIKKIIDNYRYDNNEQKISQEIVDVINEACLTVQSKTNSKNGNVNQLLELNKNRKNNILLDEMYMLPFSLPTQLEMSKMSSSSSISLNSNNNDEINVSDYYNKTNNRFVPTVPEDFMKGFS